MKLSRATILLLIAVLVTAGGLIGPATARAQQALPAEQFEESPILLVHGLGSGPGEDTFGQLQEFLETFYFTVEVMDFSEFNGSKLAKGKDAGELDTLAAVLGLKINRMLKEYKTERVNIIAHSYGGLIVHAYLLGFGEDVDKKAAYDDYVGRVLYIQTPFYGSFGDEDFLMELAEATDYANFTDPDAIYRTLMPGSEWIMKMDAAMRISDPYRRGIDILTVVSSRDNVVSDINGTFAGLLDKYFGLPTYRIYDGYTHSTNEESSSRKKKPFAYVEDVMSENFLAIASFIDGGNGYRNTGGINIGGHGNISVQFEEVKGAAPVSEKDVLLVLKAPKYDKHKDQPKKYRAFLNEESRTFVFHKMVPGDYQIRAKGKRQVRFNMNLGDRDQQAYIFKPEESQMQEVGRDGFLVLNNIAMKSAADATYTALIPDLDVSGDFEVFMTITGADTTKFDKGIVFGIYNANGNKDWDDNGSRLEVILRGDKAFSHAGRAMMVTNLDLNKDGTSQFAEFAEEKSGYKWNWQGTNEIKLRARIVNGGVEFSLWVNGLIAGDLTWDDPYYNPKPILVLGGRPRDEEHTAAEGLTFVNFGIRNGIVD